MLTIQQPHDVSFKVNVMGTSAEPTVKLVLAAHPELVFPAHRRGEEWVSTVNIPAHVEPGSYPLRVEVLVNGRHFTPVVKKVEVLAAHAEEPAPPPADTPQEPAPEVVAKAEEPSTPADDGTVEVRFENAPQEAAQEEAPKASLIKDITAAPITSKLKELAERPVPRVFAPVHTPLPRPSDVKVAPIKVNLAEVAAVSAARPVSGKKKKSPVIEIKHELPVRLVKGPVIYE